MNVLAVHLRPDEDGTELADLLVDGRSLVDILREVERPYADAEGLPKLAGAYMPLPATMVMWPSEHLLGKPVSGAEYEGRVVLLDCECGCAGCWPFVARISLTDMMVSWS